MKDIKILVSCHKKSYIWKHPFLFSIQVGAALAKKRFEADYYDDEGIEQISNKNKMYCEMTAQYWAYNNLKADYYGFFHYRRYLSFQTAYPVDRKGRLLKKAPYPYKEIDSIKRSENQFAFDPQKMRKIIEQNDIITVLREKMNVTVYQQYCQFHHKKDIDLLIKTVKDMYPEYISAMQEYLNSKKLYFMNIYIMKKECFYEYASFAFSVLQKIETTLHTEEYSEAELRVMGYLAERLFGIYYTYKRRQKQVRCCELMYLIFSDTEPLEPVSPYFEKDTNAVLIAMAANNQFVPYLSVAIQSLKETKSKKDRYDLVVLHQDIEQQNQQSIEHMSDQNFQIRFFSVKDYIRNISFPVHHHLSQETFYRYFIPEIFQKQEKLLYLDADLIFRQDPAELYRQDIEDCLVAAVRDIESAGNCKADRAYREYLIKQVGLKDPMDYMQAGVLLFNLKEFRKQVQVEDLISRTFEYKWRMLDQDVLNWKCQGEIKFLDMKWNVLMNWKYCGKSRMDIIKQAPNSLYQEYLLSRTDPAVIHYAGAWKPWQLPRCDYAEEFWQTARNSPFYETILYENTKKKIGNSRNSQENNKRIFVLKPTKIEIAVDMKKVNRFFPAGSRRRIWLRNLILR